MIDLWIFGWGILFLVFTWAFLWDYNPRFNIRMAMGSLFMLQFGIWARVYQLVRDWSYQ